MAVSQAAPEHPQGTAEDATLVAAASQGEMDAFAELYHRYAEQAWRVARRVAHNDEDARDAVAEAFAKVLRMMRLRLPPVDFHFGPYLLVAARHAAVDVVRKRARLAPSQELEELDSPTAFDQPGDRAIADEESRLITQALTGLSRREQLVLWLLEVEDKSLRAAATAVGVKPNHVAQIALRARRRLRKGYVQAHLRNDVSPACGFTVSHLAAYLDRDLGHHSLKKMEEHLSGCSDCRQRLEELKDLGLKLRHAVFLPALGGAPSPKWWPHRGRTRLGSRRVSGPLESMGGAPERRALSTVPSELMQGASAMATLPVEIPQVLAAAGPGLAHVVAAASATLLALGLSVLDGGADRGSAATAPAASQEGSVVVLAADSQGPSSGQPETPSSRAAEADPAALRPPTHAGPSASTGLGRESETPAGAQVSPGAPGPATSAGPPASTGLDRANQTPAGGQGPPTAPGPPAHAGPPASTGLDRANQTPAGGQGPPAAPGPPAHAGPPASTGLDRANQTPAGN